MKYLSAILFTVLILSVSAQAQQGQGGVAKAYTELFASVSTTVVKGAPFSAEGISESVQTLSDGNKISRKYTTKMYRDGEGRFRREGNSGAAGIGYSYVASGSGFSTYGFQDSISIFDPVANVRFILTPATKTATRMNNSRGLIEGGFYSTTLSATAASKKQSETVASGQGGALIPTTSSGVALPYLAATTIGGNAGKTESLGTRNFEGVEAEGTRTVTTIPAGAIGNERPIETVYERWYSKELQLIVYSKNSDPRYGEQTYRLVNINRSEPDRKLFAPPADYKIVPEQGFTFTTGKPKQ